MSCASATDAIGAPYPRTRLSVGLIPLKYELKCGGGSGDGTCTAGDCERERGGREGR